MDDGGSDAGTGCEANDAGLFSSALNKVVTDPLVRSFALLMGLMSTTASSMIMSCWEFSTFFDKAFRLADSSKIPKTSH